MTVDSTPAPVPADDSSDKDSEVRIAPVEGKSPAEVVAALESEAARELPPGNVRRPFVPLPPEGPLQFSLRDLLTMVTIAAVELGGLHWVPPKVYAGVTGFVALVWLLCVSLFKWDSPLAYLIWLGLLGVYLLSIALTFVPQSV